MNVRTALFGLAVFLFCVATLAPDVPVGDGGELITAARLLGVAHPPGYPLYTLAGNIALHLPLRPAVTMNLLLALFGAAAAALLFRAAWRVTGSSLAGLFAAALVALAPTFHGESTAAEVYAPALFLFLLAPTLLLGSGARSRTGGAYAAGLGAAHHPIGLFYLPFLALLAVRKDAAPRGRVLGVSALLFVLSLTVIVYLPIRARSETALRWGNPSTFAGAVAHTLRLDYGDLPGVTKEKGAGAAYGGELRRGARVIVDETGVAAPALALLGLVILLRRARSLAALLAAAMAAGFFGVLAMIDFAPGAESLSSNRIFLLPVVVMIAGAAAVGLAAVAKASRLRAAMPLLVALLLATRLGGAYPGERRGDHVAGDLARAYLAPLPANASLRVDEGKLLTALLYEQQAEGVRTDVRIEAPKGVWRPAPGPPGPLFFAGYDVAGGTPVTPQGLALYAAPPGKSLLWRDEWDRIALRAPPPDRIGSMAREVLFGFYLRYARNLAAAGREERAREELGKASAYADRAEEGALQLARGYHQAGLPEEALAIFRAVADADPADWKSRLFVGAILGEEGRDAEARAAFEEVVRIAPERPEGHLYLAGLLLNAGDREGAAREAAAGARLAPNHPLAKALRQALTGD